MYKKYIPILIALLIIIGGSFRTVSGLAVFQYIQGGTGTTTAPVSQLIYGGSTAYQSVATTTLTASSPLSLSNPVVKVGGSNSTLTLDTSGTWSGNAGTATALAANGTNCLAGNYPLGVDASGNVETCTAITGGTSAFEIATTSTISVPQLAYFTNASGRTTLGGVATTTLSGNSQISLSNPVVILGGSASVLSITADSIGDTQLAFNTGQNLTTSSDVTFNKVTSAYSSSTAYSSFQIASSSSWFGGGLTTCSNGTTDKVLYNSTTGLFSCGTDQTGVGGSGITSLGPTGQLQTGATQFLATSTTGTNFTITSTGDTHTFNLPVASAVNTGKLSATDWSTFNSKLSSYDAWTHPSYGGSATTSLVTFSDGIILSSASSTAVGGSLHLDDLSQGFLYIKSNKTLGTFASSTASLSWFTNDLANLTAANSTLTFSGNYNGSVARTVGLNLSNPNTWTGLQTFANSTSTLFSASYASTTDLFVGNILTIPSGVNPIANDIGEIAHDTSGHQLIVDDFVMGQAENVIWSRTIASTSPAFMSGGLMPLPTRLDGFTITRIQCHVVTGTSKVIAIEDASANSSEDVTCATTNTTDDGSITNATFSASELGYIDFGATTGSVDYVNITVYGQWTRE